MKAIKMMIFLFYKVKIGNSQGKLSPETATVESLNAKIKAQLSLS